jgi:uracil-DNA glycosylase
MEEREALEGIAREVSVCKRCPLAFGRTKSVPGSGPAEAEIMLIGEGPGYHEDRQGLPFVGAAGQFLDNLLASINLDRKVVYITNVVKCRPPGNRDPQPEELEACRSYLDRQIAIIKPKVIVTLGRYSMQRWFPEASISRIHGQAKRDGDMMIVAMFHPAAALHQPKYRPMLLEDFGKLPGYIALLNKEQPVQKTASAPTDDIEQLSLF